MASNYSKWKKKNSDTSYSDWKKDNSETISNAENKVNSYYDQLSNQLAALREQNAAKRNTIQAKAQAAATNTAAINSAIGLANKAVTGNATLKTTFDKDVTSNVSGTKAATVADKTNQILDNKTYSDDVKTGSLVKGYKSRTSNNMKTISDDAYNYVKSEKESLPEGSSNMQAVSNLQKKYGYSEIEAADIYDNFNKYVSKSKAEAQDKAYKSVYGNQTNSKLQNDYNATNGSLLSGTKNVTSNTSKTKAEAIKQKADENAAADIQNTNNKVNQTNSVAAVDQQNGTHTAQATQQYNYAQNSLNYWNNLDSSVQELIARSESDQNAKDTLLYKMGWTEDDIKKAQNIYDNVENSQGVIKTYEYYDSMFDGISSEDKDTILNYIRAQKSEIRNTNPYGQNEYTSYQDYADALKEIRNKYGEDKYNAFLKAADYYIDYENEVADSEWIQSMINQDGWQGVANAAVLNAADILGTPLSVVGTADTIAQRISGNKVPNPYNAAHQYDLYSQDVQNATNEAISNPIGQFAYGAIDSTLRSAYTMALGGGLASSLGMGEKATKALSQLITLPVFSASALNSSYKQSMENGMGAGDAMKVAIANGIFEGLFEEISFDKLWGTVNLDKSLKKNVILDLLATAGIEGSEEGFTDIADWVAENIIAGDYSEMNTLKRQYMAEGMTEDQAKSAVMKHYASQLAQDVAAGAISGGLHGGSAIAISNLNVNTNSLAKNVMKAGTDAVEELRQNVLNINDDSAAVQIAKTKTADEMTKSDVQTMIRGAKVSASEESTVKDVLINTVAEERNISTDQATEVVNSYLNKATSNSEGTNTNDSTVGDTNTQPNVTMARNGSNNASEQTINTENTENGSVEADQGSLDDETVSRILEENKSKFAGQTALNTAIRTTALNKEIEKQNKKITKQTRKEIQEYVNKNGTVAAHTVLNNQKEVHIAKFEMINDSKGNTTVPVAVLSDGSRMLYADVQIENKNLATALDYVKTTEDANAMNTAREMFNSNVLDAKAFGEAGAGFYNQGRINWNVDNSEAVFQSILNGNDALAVSANQVNNTAYLKRMFYLGQNAAAEFNQEDAAIEEAKTETINEKAEKKNVKKNAGKVIDQRDGGNGIEDTWNKIGRVVAEATGLTVVLNDDITKNNTNGNFTASLGRLMVNTTTGREYQTFIHELSEFGMAYNEKKMKNLVNAVLSFINTEKGASYLNDSLLHYRDVYRASVEANKSIEQAGDEYVFDVMAGIFSQDGGMEAFNKFLEDHVAESRRSEIRQTLADIFDKIVEAIKNFFSGRTSGSRYEGYHMALENAEQFRNAWLDIIGGAIENYNAGAEGSSEEAYSIEVTKNMSWEDQLKARKNGNLRSSDYLYLGESLNFDNKIPGGNLPIAISQGVITKAQRIPKGSKSGHSMSDSDIENLFEEMKHPISVSYEQSRNSIVYLLDYKSSGSYVAVSMTINSRVGKNIVDDVTSVHQRTTPDALFAKADKTLVYKKEKFNNIIETSTIYSHALDNKIEFVNSLSPSSEKSSNSIEADSTGKELTADQQQFYADEDPLLLNDKGQLKRYYHGTARMDRVGTVFRPDRATSGPMAFFTDDPKIAENYSKDKADTSMAYDDKYSDYYSQFTITKADGREVPITKMFLTAKQEATIRERAKHVGFDDDYENIIYDENITNGLGNWDYELKNNRGKTMRALVDAWLMSGELFNDEGRFLEVLKLVGLDNEVTYHDPEARSEGVYEVYLHVTKALDTSNIPDNVVTALQERAEKEEYDPDKNAAADMWDKNGVEPSEWIREFNDDIKNGTSYAWTRIPDWVTDTLKSFEYDGIADNGGKYHADSHQVVIPFNSNQVKNVDNEHPTENEDIRYSIEADDIDSLVSDLKNSVEIDEDLMAILSGEAEDIEWEDGSTTTNSNKYLQDAVNILEEGAKAVDYVELDQRKILKMAREIKKYYSSDVEASDIADSLSKVFAYMSRNQDTSYSALLGIMKDIATPIIENSSDIDAAEKEDYDNARKFLKNYKISLSDNQKKEVAYQYGNYNTYRKSLFGLVSLTNKGMQLDDVWTEMCDNLPGLDVTTPDLEQPAALADYLEALKPIAKNPYGQDKEQAAYDCAMEIYKRFMEYQIEEAAVEKAEQKLKPYKDNLVAAMKSYKESTRENYKKAVAEEYRIAERDKNAKLHALAEKIDQLDEQQESALTEGDEYTSALLEVEKLKNKAKIDRLRKQNDKKIAEIKAKNRESRLNERDRRKNTELKGRVRSAVNSLNSMLTSPNVDNHMKKSLVRPVIDVLETINLDTGKSKLMKEKLERLSKVYDQYREDKRFDLDYDQNVADMIEDLSATFEGRNYTELTNDELEKVLRMVTALRQQIRNANKLIQNQKVHDAYQAARSAVKEIEGSRGTNGVASEKLNQFNTWQLNAYREFRKLSGYDDDSVIMSLYDEFAAGELKQISIQKEANELLADILEGNDNQKEMQRLISTKPEDLVDIGLKDDAGNPVLVTRDMRMSLIMHSYNDQNMSHILNGGLTVPNLKMYAKGKGKDAYNHGNTYRFVSYETATRAAKAKAAAMAAKNDEALWQEYLAAQQALNDERAEAALHIKALEDSLSDWEKKYLDKAKTFFHQFTGKYINEVTEELRGYAVASVKNYFPIATDPDFTKTELGGLIMDGTLEGWGNLKSRVNATNAILLEGSSNVMMRSIDKTSSYAAYAIPVRDLNSVWKRTFTNKNGKPQSVESVIAHKWGLKDQNFIKDFASDIQNGRHREHTWLENLRSNFAGATLTANIGVAMKQAASYPTAAAVVGWTPLAKALKDMGKGAIQHGIPELEAINPLLWNRTQGNSSQEIAYAKKSNIYRAMDSHKATKWMKAISVDLIQNVDVATVTTLEYASKYYVDQNFKNLEKGSDEYWQKVSEIFSKVVTETQPNYTTLQRPDVLRSTNDLFRQLVLFKTQPLQNFGIVYDALNECITMQKQQKANKTDENVAKYKQAKKHLARALSSQITAAVVFSAMTLIANSFYHKYWKYDQDDKKPMWLEMLQQFGLGVMSSIMGAVTFGDILYQTLDKAFFGGSYYGLEINTLELLNDSSEVFTNYVSYGKALAKAETTADVNNVRMKMIKNTKDLVNNVGDYMGVPVNNLYSTVDSIFMYSDDLLNGDPIGTSQGMINTSDLPTQKDLEMDALESGDTEEFDRLVEEDIKASDAADPESTVWSAVKTRLKEEYQEGNVSEDQAEGYLEEYWNMEESDIDKQIYKWDNNLTSVYGGVHDAMDKLITDPDDSKTFEEAKACCKDLIDMGYEAKAIGQNLRSAYRDQYLAASTSEKVKIKAAVVKVLNSIGFKTKTYSNAIEYVNSWSETN